MKIVFFWDYYGPYHFARLNGAVSAARDTEYEAVGLELAGKSATYAWRRDASPAGVEFHTLFADETAEKISAIRVYRAVSQYLSTHESACLFVPSYWPAYALAATLAARRHGVKVVLMAESHYASGRNEGTLVWVKRCFMKLYASALVGGSAQRSFFRYLGIPDTHLFDGYDAVNNEYFTDKAAAARGSELEWREKLNLPRRYILSLGRFVAKKNLHVLIHAYASARKQGKLRGVHLLFVGSGPEKDSLIHLADSLGLRIVHSAPGQASPADGPDEDYTIHFHPFTQIDKSPAYFALAECFVLASQVEEWGLVVNEAMACGCPVIVSRLVGCSFDLVESGVTGFRFSPDNPDELAWYIAAVCSDRTLSANLIDRAHERVARWGPARFGANAVLAARAAETPQLPAKEDEAAPRPILLLQTSFPDYRIPVYEGLSRSVGPRFFLYTGAEYFTPDVRTCSEFRPWIYMVKNTFIFKRRLLWQGGVLGEMLEAEVAIMELNPRILSNWLILLTRKIWARPTLLWGHAWGREGASSFRNLLRLLMMRLATGVVTYTHSQRVQLERILPGYRFYTAPNSLVTKKECVVDDCGNLDTILYVGRMNAAKKPALLLEAFLLLRSRLPAHVRLCFVGTGDELPKLQERARNESAGERVVFMGHVSNRGILRSLYARAFCAVSPGYVGLSAIQAFSFGLPMVIADHEDHAPEIEACKEGENTVFFPSGNVDALADCLGRMWEDRQAWQRKRQSISTWTAENYSTDAMVESFSRAISHFDI